MHPFRSGVALVGRRGLGPLMLGALGLLTLGALGPLTLGAMSSEPSRSGAASTPTAPALALVRPTTTLMHPAEAPPHRAPREWSFQIDEATLAQHLNAWAAGQSFLQTPLGRARLEHLSVHLRDDQLVLQGVAEAGWLVQPVALAGTASVDAGHALVHVRTARMGGMDLPEPARHALEQQLQDQLDRSAAEYHATVHSVHIAEGMLLVSGTRQ